MICHSPKKVRFRTELDAKIALAKRVNQDKGEVRHYRCQGHFHLTSQALKTRAA